MYIIIVVKKTIMMVIYGLYDGIYIYMIILVGG